MQAHGGVRIIHRPPDLDGEPSSRVLVAGACPDGERTEPHVGARIVGERGKLRGAHRRCRAPRELEADPRQPCVGAREEPSDRRIVLGHPLPRVGPEQARRSSQGMDERRAVRAVEEDRAPAPRAAHDEHHRERGAERRRQRVADEDHGAGDADRDRHADPLDRRLDGEPLSLRYGLVGDVDRGARRPVRQRDVRDAGRRDREQQRERAGACPGQHDKHGDRERQEHERVRRDPHPQPVAAQQWPREEEQERDARDVDRRGVAREEPREVGGVGELGARPVEHEVVAELAAERRQDLVPEDERDEAAREQPPERRVVAIARRTVARRGRRDAPAGVPRTVVRSPRRARRTPPAPPPSRTAVLRSARTTRRAGLREGRRAPRRPGTRS